MTPAFFRNRPVSSVRLRIVTAILIQFTAVVASGADVEVFDTISSGAHGMAFLAQKIREGQTVRAGFIGGSITQGAGVKKPADSWYAKTRGHLAGFAKTTGAKVETRLAAVGGTGTLYGAIRLGAQLLDKGPLDLLVVEFAVNDFKNPVALDGMEGIVRQALRSNPRMAIVLFYTTNRAMIEECYNKGILPPSVAAFHRVARHYNLAEVHAGPEVRALFRENRITPENFFPDKTHPSAEGHAFYAKHLSDALITALKSADIPLPPLPLPPPAPAALPAPLGSGHLEHARLFSVVPVEKSGDWTENKPGYYTYSGSWKTTVPGSSISLDVKGGRIWLLCGKTSRLRIIGTDTNEKILTPGNRRNGTPSLLLIHEGGEFSGRITVTVEPDASGNTRAELAGVAAVIVPPSCKQRHNLPSNPTQPDPT